MNNYNELPQGMHIEDSDKYKETRESATIDSESVMACEDNRTNIGYCTPQPAAPMHIMPSPGVMDAYTMMDMAAVGVSFKQAQVLNSKRQNNMLDLEQKVRGYQAELSFIEQKYILEQRYHGIKCANESVGIENFGTTPSLNIPSLLEAFRLKYHIVKERVNGSLDWRFLIRELDGLRHVPCDEKELNELFFDFLEETVNYDISQAEGKRLFEKLKRRHVPKLSNADLKMIPDSSLVFRNGLLDIVNNSFSTSLPANRFNRFAMDFDYPQDSNDPLAFEAMLDDIFHDNADWKKLCYQIIGALLSPAATLKRIYVFQGVSNAGKTRLSNIIMRMMDETDITEFNTLSDITTSDKDTQLHHTRLVNIKEASNKKISAKQCSYLKGYADGGSSAAMFKILVATNYMLTTGDDGELESTLRNRFIVLPFPNAMTSEDPRVASFEDCYFEHEMPYIVRKSLEAFSEVLRNDGMFCTEPEINKYIADDTLNGITGGTSNSTIEPISIIKKIFRVGEDYNMELTPQDILDKIKEIVSDTKPFDNMSTSSLSRILRYELKDSFKSKRINNTTRYNLFLRDE